MEHRQTEQHAYLLRLARGEYVIETLQKFCEQEGIQAATFTAIGALKHTEIGYYSFEKREYFFKTLDDDREVASMTGNVALVEGKPFVHAHAVLSAGDDSLSCVGGHVKEAQVAVTLEIVLTTYAELLERAYDDETGLKLWHL